MDTAKIGKAAAPAPDFLHLTRLDGENSAKWAHLCIRHKATRQFLIDEAQMEDLIVDAMLQEDARSRVRIRPAGIMTLLKTMPLQSDGEARPGEMASLRVWIDESRIITTREAELAPVLDLARRIEAGTGPKTPGRFLADLIAEHLQEIDPQIEALEDQVDRIGGMVTGHQIEEACPAMVDALSRISGFIRHLGPQQIVLETLSAADHPVLDDHDRARIEDSANQLMRILEALQNLRDRVDILDNQVSRVQDRKISQNSLAFAVAATIFLPLGFLTGLFGANVGGIPMAQPPWGFWALLGGCVALIVVVVSWLRSRKLF
ncbi:CorA family divalent cation transporter [Paracoccus sp. SCSIO 75233]|uniref:CorA family divalent cation transporter n=1 Tax=Paracoccus sp. SCSIO 75233 TaxID=3017782 RepID=UPI0022F0BD53|nr:CorA family divalent cation transporter [Paracoccus sp. SCSIO 75233]WBU53378.1 hypothetical protein PAF12_00615 [Paracoccus sp. SCSIO 75233]